MTVHLYALCWNDAKMLPFFFRHYDAFVDRYVIHDDGSTDDSVAILRRHPRVDVRPFVRRHPDSFAVSEQAMSDECWKESRGQADWVIVTDLDEHLFHAGMRAYLSRCLRDEVTMIPALGFQMVSDSPPREDETLCWSSTKGAPWAQMMKLSIFDPNHIEEIRFAIGRHTADPVGRTVVPRIDEVLLLHYKYMGFEPTLRRHRQLLTGLRGRDLSEGWGHKYSWSREQLAADWDETKARAVDTTTMRRNPAGRYPIRPWWDKYRAHGAAE